MKMSTLDLLVRTAVLVLGNLRVLLARLEVVVTIAAHVADGNSSFLGALVDELDELFTPLLREGR